MPVRRATTNDIGFLEMLWNHPNIRPFIVDDAAQNNGHNMDWPTLLSNPFLVFLILVSETGDDAGCFFAHPWNAICYEVHALILPQFRGSQAVKFTNEGVQWSKENTGCKKIVTQVPTYNKRAYALAVRAGFKLEGMNTRSFQRHGKLYDQYFLGLRTED